MSVVRTPRVTSMRTSSSPSRLLSGCRRTLSSQGSRSRFSVKIRAETTSSESATTSSSQEDGSAVVSKNLEVMRKFSEQYAKRSGTYFCMDKSVTAVVIQGLAEHKDELGAPLCPCRHYDDKALEAEQGFWNCPCVPMRERKECHCMLFLTEDNDFAGDEQTITPEELDEFTEGMK